MLKKNVCMIIAEKDFRDEELLVPKSYLERQQFTVTVASTITNTVRGMLSTLVVPTVHIKDIKVEDYDAIVFIGGNGAKQYWDDPVAHTVAKRTFELGKILGAICIAPVILARAGLLKGVKASVWPEVADELENSGAMVVTDNVTSDGRIITANGPNAADEFAETIYWKIYRKVAIT